MYVQPGSTIGSAKMRIQAKYPNMRVENIQIVVNGKAVNEDWRTFSSLCSDWRTAQYRVVHSRILCLV